MLTDDSNSIQNQKSMLIQYALHNNCMTFAQLLIYFSFLLFANNLIRVYNE